MNVSKPPTKSFTSWNFKKANWEQFSSLSKVQFSHIQITKNSDVAERCVRNAIMTCAKKSIPRGKMTDYKPYWNERLADLTTKRNKAVKSVE